MTTLYLSPILDGIILEYLETKSIFVSTAGSIGSHGNITICASVVRNISH